VFVGSGQATVFAGDDSVVEHAGSGHLISALTRRGRTTIDGTGTADLSCGQPGCRIQSNGSRVVINSCRDLGPLVCEGASIDCTYGDEECTCDEVCAPASAE
jgi:hypothetical protein